MDELRIDFANIFGALCHPATEGREAVFRHHVGLFTACTRAERSLLAAREAEVGGDLGDLEAGASRIADELKGLDLFCRSPDQGGTPWSGLDRAKVCIYGALTAAMMALAIYTNSNLLIQAGFFSNRYAAAAFSGIPLTIPVVLEIFVSSVRVDRTRRRFQQVLCLLAAAGAMGYAVLFGLQYGQGMTQTEAQAIAEAMRAFGSAGGPGEGPSLVGRALLLTGMVTEALIAAVAFGAIELIASSHKPVVSVANPERVVRERELAAIRLQRSALTELERGLHARRQVLDALAAAFVGRAVGLYDVFFNLAEPWGPGPPVNRPARSSSSRDVHVNGVKR